MDVGEIEETKQTLIFRYEKTMYQKPQFSIAVSRKTVILIRLQLENQNKDVMCDT